MTPLQVSGIVLVAIAVAVGAYLGSQYTQNAQKAANQPQYLDQKTVTSTGNYPVAGGTSATFKDVRVASGPNGALQMNSEHVEVTGPKGTYTMDRTYDSNGMQNSMVVKDPNGNEDKNILTPLGNKPQTKDVIDAFANSDPTGRSVRQGQITYDDPKAINGFDPGVDNPGPQPGVCH